MDEQEEIHIIPIGDLSVKELMEYPIEEIMKYEWYYDIPGYERLYQCNNFGNVYGIKRQQHLSKHINKIENRVNYTLFKNGKGRCFNAAKLVLLTFHGNPPKNKINALHRDGNSRNDRLDNLYWGSFIENERDKKNHGKALIGEKHHQAVLTEKRSYRN